MLLAMPSDDVRRALYLGRPFLDEAPFDVRPSQMHHGAPFVHRLVGLHPKIGQAQSRFEEKLSSSNDQRRPYPCNAWVALRARAILAKYAGCLSRSCRLEAKTRTSNARSSTTERGTLSASRHVVVDVDVNMPIRRHVLDTEPTIAIAVGV